MNLRRWILGHRPDKGDEVDERIEAAGRKLADLHARADRVVPDLEQRDRRNCWAESIDLLLREGRRA